MEMFINSYQCEWVGIAIDGCTRAISVWKLKRKLVGVHQLACSWRPRAFEEAHHWNIQAKFYNKKFPLVIYESDKMGDSLSWRTWCYFEAQVWKKDSKIVPSLFSHLGFFGLFSFILDPLASFIFYKVRSLISAYGGIIVSIILSSLGQCSNNDDHHTFIYLQLNV